MSIAVRWSPWKTLPLSLAPAILAETLDGGQSFRWSRNSDGEWIGIWGGNIVKLTQDADHAVRWSTPLTIADDAEIEIHRYLGHEPDLAAQTNVLPWRSDAHLAACLNAFPGLRILRQPFGETLLCFLCSATKQIVQIKQMVTLLAERHGTEIVPGFHRLPTWNELALVSEKKLQACKLGFRARYISETARFIAANPGWLEATETAPYAQAKVRLCSVPGVGEKVADCVLLFGAGRLEAFPVDVWILRTMARRYGLDGWKPAQVAHFGRRHFGPLAGLAQQYLFSYERRAEKPLVV